MFGRFRFLVVVFSYDNISTYFISIIAVVLACLKGCVTIKRFIPCFKFKDKRMNFKYKFT